MGQPPNPYILQSILTQAEHARARADRKAKFRKKSANSTPRFKLNYRRSMTEGKP